MKEIMGRIGEVIEQPLSRRRNTRFRGLQKDLLDLGFQMRQQGRGGGHYVFKHPAVDAFIVLVSHGRNDILPDYQVMKAVRVIERLKEVTKQ